MEYEIPWEYYIHLNDVWKRISSMNINSMTSVVNSIYNINEEPILQNMANKFKAKLDKYKLEQILNDFNGDEKEFLNLIYAVMIKFMESLNNKEYNIFVDYIKAPGDDKERIKELIEKANKNKDNTNKK